MRPHYHARKHTGCVVTVKDGRGYGVGTKREQATEQLNDRTTAHRAGKNPVGKMTPLHALSSLSPLTSRPHSCCSALHHRLTYSTICRKEKEGGNPCVGTIRVERVVEVEGDEARIRR